jgi:hypothetical protein
VGRYHEKQGKTRSIRLAQDKQVPSLNGKACRTKPTVACAPKFVMGEGAGDYVQSNMNVQFRRFLRKRIRHPRPRQLELNLWTKRQTLSAAFSKESAMTRNRR